MSTTLIIKSAWAEMHGAPEEVLTEALTFDDPKRFFNKAFREGRWDGKVTLSRGKSFPAGLWQHVKHALEEKGYEVAVQGLSGKALDLSRMTPEYLPGITLWDHQMLVINAFLTNTRGHGRVMTGMGKTEIYIAVARYYWEERGWRTLVVVPRKGLARQTAARARLYYGGDLKVGQYGDGEKTTGVFTVATAQSLRAFKKQIVKKRIRNADPVLRELVEGCEVLVTDEVHHASAESWYDIAMHSNARRRFGLSGTPVKDIEISDVKMVGVTGPSLFDIGLDEMVKAELATPPKIALIMSDDASEPPLPDSLPYQDCRCEDLPEGSAEMLHDAESEDMVKGAYVRGVVESRRHNLTVVEAVRWLIDRGRTPLILVRRKKQWQLLRHMLDKFAVQHLAIWGETRTLERDRIKRLYEERKIDALLATTVFDEGEDLRGIDAVVLAEGVKASVNCIQRVGRGMGSRRARGGDLWVVDIVPTCHRRLMKHALRRSEVWHREGYEMVTVTKWITNGEVERPDLLPFERWEEACAEEAARYAD